jgi:hypothetical protein
MVMSKNFESTSKRINLPLRRYHSFKHFKPIQISCLQDVKQVRNFTNVYVPHRHYLMCKKPATQFTIKLKFCFECTIAVVGKYIDNLW